MIENWDRTARRDRIKRKSYITVDRSKWTPSGKTRIWQVSRDGAEGFRFKLGEIRWYSGWRRYVFRPTTHTLFDADCLRTLADHCQMKTQDHKQARAKYRIREGLKVELDLPMEIG